MEFKFKRKYTFFFFIALLLHLLVISFWFFFPNDLLKSAHEKQTITLIALINCELILIFYLGLFRQKYYAYHDKLIIKRSLFKDTTINYSTINKIKDNPRDTIFLVFGHRPSFTIYYTEKNNKKKKIIIRSDNSKLLQTIIKNEINISTLNNKKLTK